MYRLRHFKEIYGKCCDANVDSPSPFNEYSSSYDIHPFSLENFMETVIRLLTPCEIVYLGWLYWYVLLLSILKMYNTVHELNAVFGQAKKLFIFQDRQLLHISYQWRNKVRQFVVCLVGIIDVYLAMGILMMKPHYMTPWINVQFFTLAIDVLLHIPDICCGTVQLSFQNFVRFLFIYFNVESVWCVRKIFVHLMPVDNNANSWSLF